MSGQAEIVSNFLLVVCVIITLFMRMRTAAGELDNHRTLSSSLESTVFGLGPQRTLNFGTMAVIICEMHNLRKSCNKSVFLHVQIMVVIIVFCVLGIEWFFSFLKLQTDDTVYLVYSNC